MMIVDTANSNR